MNTKLNRLEKVDLRQVWLNESSNFTPWLAQKENLELLGNTVGISLELAATETAVGAFTADIVCVNTEDDTKVLIENQLEKTDHRHLGQIITYAAGLEAVTVIWLAERITEEHRAAIDWLNDITEEGYNFFGLEIELWRIGDSDIAPKFNVVSKPNEWARNIASAMSRELTEDKQLQLDFWTGFKTYMVDQGSVIRMPSAKPRAWMDIPIGRAGIHLAAIASLWDSNANTCQTNELRAQLYLKGSNAKNRFKLLEQMRSEIEDELGESLIWYNPEDAKMSRIYLRKTVDLRNYEKRTEQYRWLKEKLEKLYEVFSTRVRDL
ncbi:MAG TPA: DUF4268 domain-containing protein [Firmicutes bacterium]|nr:DUF4268 domain-containing protein [Bacillota bacterium]